MNSKNKRSLQIIKIKKHSDDIWDGILSKAVEGQLNIEMIYIQMGICNQHDKELLEHEYKNYYN